MFNLIIILLSTLNDEPKGSNNYKIAKYMIENMRSEGITWKKQSIPFH